MSRVEEYPAKGTYEEVHLKRRNDLDKIYGSVPRCPKGRHPYRCHPDPNTCIDDVRKNAGRGNRG